MKFKKIILVSGRHRISERVAFQAFKKVAEYCHKTYGDLVEVRVHSDKYERKLWDLYLRNKRKIKRLNEYIKDDRDLLKIEDSDLKNFLSRWTNLERCVTPLLRRLQIVMHW